MLSTDHGIIILFLSHNLQVSPTGTCVLKPALFAGGAINLLTALLRLDRVDKYFGPKEKALTKIMTLQDWDDLANRKTLVSEVCLCSLSEISNNEN